MVNTLIIYSTNDGLTLEISKRLAAILEQQVSKVILCQFVPVTL